MAQGEGDFPVSKGALPGASNVTAPLQKAEKLNIESPIPSFGQAFNNLAMTPTVLGEMGAKTAIAASTAIAKQEGARLGKNPYGDLLPAITDTDKSFVESYSNQANATLGLQGQALLQKGQQELEQSYKLTPDLIASYEENMSAGLRDISSHAPSTIRSQLENNMAAQLLRNSGTLNTRMISEQKETARNQMTLYTQNQVKGIYESARSGQSENAAMALSEIDRISKQQVQSGMFTPLQADANAQSAKQAYYIGTMSKQAFDAKSSGQLEPFLASMASQKPPEGVSFLEWQSIGQGVLKDVAAAQSLEAQNQTLVLSQLALKSSEVGGLTQNDITEAAAQLRPAQLNTFLASQASKNTKQNQAAIQQNLMVAAFNDANSDAWATGTPKTINAAYNAINNANKLANPEKSDMEIQTETALAAGGEIPAFVGHINNSLINGTPQAQIQAMQQYLKVYDDRPGNVNAVSQNAKQMAFALQSFLPFHDPVEASMMAKEAIFGQTKDSKIANDESWKSIRNSNWSTPNNRISQTKDLLNIGRFTDVQDLETLTIQAEHALEYNYKALNGNMEAAKELTKHNFSAAYGETWVNGKKELAYLPINQVAQLGEDGNGVIQGNIAEELTPQLAVTKEAYDLGHNDYYYRVVPRPSFESVMANKELIQKEFGRAEAKGSLFSGDYEKSRARYLELRKPIDEYNSGHPTIVERVERNTQDGKSDGKVTQYEVYTKASPYMAKSVNAQQPVIGDYDIRGRDKEGNIVSLPIVTSGQAQSLAYRPNLQKIRQQYYAVNGLTGTQKTTDELYKEWEEHSKKTDVPLTNRFPALG